MGKVIAKKISGMNWMAKVSLVLVCTLLAIVFMREGWYGPKTTLGAIAAPQPWSSLYNSNGNPGALNYTVNPGANRLMVVAVSSSIGAVSAAQTCTVTYGGQQLVEQISDKTSSAQQHTWLFYLNEAGIQAAGSNTGITVTVTSGGQTLVNNAVYATVFTGVNQTAPITDSRNYNSGTGTTYSPSFSTALTENAGDQPVIIVNSTRTGSTTAQSISATTNWTKIASASTSTNPAVATAVLNRSIPATNTSNTTGATIGSAMSSSLASMSGMSIAAVPPNTILGNGVAVSAGSVCPGTTQKLAGFSLSAAPYNDSVSALTVTTTGTAMIAGMSIWDEAGTTQYFTTQSSPSGNNWNFSAGTPIPVTSTTTNYKVQVTYTSTAPGSSTATTAYVSAFTSAQASSGSNTVGSAITVKGRPAAPSWNYPLVSGPSIRLSSIGTGSDFVMVVRYPNASDSTVPVDGTTYSANAPFGTGTIVSVGSSSTTITDTPPAGTYYYKAFGYTACSTYSSASSFSSAVSYATVASSSPSALSPGTTQDVLVNGAGFVSGSSVSFSNAGIAINGGTTYVSPTQLKVNVTISAGATGTSNISVASFGRPTVTGTGLISIVPPNTILGNGVAVSAASVCPGTTQKLAGFSLSAAPYNDSVSALTVTTTGTAMITGMSIWDEAGNTQYFTTQSSPSGNNWNFSAGTPIPATATPANYKVQVTYTSTAPGSNTTTTAYVSAFTSAQASSGSNTVGPAITVKGRPGTPSWNYPLVSGPSISLSSIGSNSDYVMVVRYPNTSDSTIPVNGTTYSANTPFGTGTIVSVGSFSTTITDTPPAGTYYYKAFGYTACSTYSSASSFSSAVSYATVASASPSALSPGTTQDVLVNGAGFVSGSSVSFSNAGIAINGGTTYLSSTQLKVNVTLSAVATGTSNISVASSGRPTATGTGLISLVPLPAITTLSPAVVYQGTSNYAVAVNGSNFQDGATVTFSGGDIAVTTTFVNSSRLTASVSIPADAVLSVRDVTVTNPIGGAAVKLGALTVAPPLYTIPGVVTFTQVSRSSMTVQVGFSGDSDGDNTCVITWGESNGSYPNIAVATRQGGKYSATVSGLAGSADGAGKAYYFKAIFSDADGVAGANPVFGASSTKGSPLMHNSLNLGSGKWPQGWGVLEGKYGPFTCSTCHSKNTSNIKLVAGMIQTPSLENWSSVKSGNVIQVTYLNPATNMGSDSTHATSANICEVCHSRTDHHRYDNANANHMGTKDCTPCHSHRYGFSPDSNGGQSCAVCHTTLNSGSYHHDLSSTGACLNCHTDHNIFRSDLNPANSAGRAANLRADAAVAPVAGLPATQSNTDFNAASDNGGLCVSCHQNPQTKPDATQTESLVKTDFASSGHNFTVSSTFSKDNSTFLANCSKCHSDAAAKKFQTAGSQFSTHGSNAADILASLGDPAPSVSGFCFRCHSQTSDALAGTTKPTSGKDYYGVASMSKDAEGIFAVFQKTGSVHNQIHCTDCHNAHAAKAGSHAVGSNTAGPPLNGASGMRLQSFPAFWTAPIAGNFSAAAAVRAGIDPEAYVCFKCHTASAGTLPNSPSGGFTMTDVAKEFNPNNKGAFSGTWSTGVTAGGGHPILDTAGNHLGAIDLANLVTTNFAWSKTSRNLMACSDCHGSNTTTDPNGPHGSAAKFLLRGPNTKWDGTLTLSGSSMPAGTFCANCHSSTYSNSRFPYHTFGSHSGIPCFNCHAAVPHGGPRAGILAPGAGAATAVGGSITNFDNAAPYWQGGGANKLYIKSYPTNNTTDWSQPNCGCNGTSHGMG